MQIYGILLNICGILLNNRGKKQRNTENFMEFCGFFTENAWKIIPFHSFLFLFFPQPLAG